MPAPIIVTALFSAADFAWLDRMRRSHFPPERNVVPAHLTLFHHLPPSIERELIDRLRAETSAAPPPHATIASVLDLGGGVAYRIESAELADVRARLADAFAGLLVPQDQAGWRPHVTIQNKVTATTARALHAELSAGFRPRPLAIRGLAAWRYRGGPWEPIGDWTFRAGARSRVSRPAPRLRS